MQLPVPDIEKQKAIVKEYNTIVNRIKINEQLNQKLEETAQAIYKEWFVEFEFPISKEYADSIGKPELEGKAYKSNSGEMVWNEELGNEIPKGWRVKPFTRVVSLSGGGTPSTENKTYWNGEIPFFTPKDIESSYYSIKTGKCLTIDGLNNCSSKLYPKDTVFVTARGTVGAVSIAGSNMAMNQSCYAILGNANYNQYFTHQLTLYTIKKLKSEAIGAVFNALVTKDFEGQYVIVPTINIAKFFGSQIQSIYNLLLNYEKENMLNQNTKDSILSRMAKG
jgi:type I restriction enzyme S subunit